MLFLLGLACVGGLFFWAHRMDRRERRRKMGLPASNGHTRVGIDWPAADYALRAWTRDDLSGVDDRSEPDWVPPWEEERTERGGR